MDLMQLKKELKDGVVRSCYYFTGPEAEIKKIYIHKVAEVAKAEIVHADSLEAIYANLRTGNLVNRHKLYVIHDDLDFVGMGEGKAWNAVNSGKAQSNNVLIFTFNSLDKRSKFYKAMNNSFCEFEFLSTPILEKYVAKECNLNTANSIMLISMCNNDYSRILLECDKIRTLAQARHMDVNKAFEFCILEGLIYQPPQDVVFDMIDAAARRQKQLAFSLYETLVENNEGSIKILSIMYNTFRNMFSVMTAGNGAGITERTGLTSWQIMKAKEVMGSFSQDGLRDAMRLIRKAEIGIKQGQMEDAMAVPYVLVNL